MAVDKITSSDFGDQIAEGVNDRDKTIDTRIGPIRDVFIDPVAEVLENQNDRVVYVNKLVSLSNAGDLVPDDIDSVVSNENMVRWAGSRSIVTLTFSRSTAPTVDITVPVNFPVATMEDPATGNSVTFKTIESQTMSAATPSRYYNATTGKYDLSVVAASVVQGITTQIGAETITRFLRPITGFDTVTNSSSTTSGRAIETNTELASRYFLHVEGAQAGTPSGFKRFILDNLGTVTDAYVVYGNNEYLTRQASDAGAIDVWLLGSVPTTRQFVTSYNGTYTLNVVDFQPLISVTSVSSTATGLTYTEGTDYTVETGVGEYAYSALASDGIRWIPGGSHPAIDDDVVITYEYNSLINVAEAFFNQEEYLTMGSDRLFRWAQPKYLEIEANLKVKSGSPSSVQALVREAVMTYINALKLGEDVEEFDLDTTVGRVFGVDNWTYTILAIKDSTGVGDIEVPPNQYARILNSDFVINLV